jgi:hypothetical protein
VSVSHLGSKREQLEVQPGALQVVVSPATAAALERHRAEHGDQAGHITRRVA